MTTATRDEPTLSSGRVLVVRCFYGALAALLASTVVAQVILTHDQGRSIVNMFSYFTIQSNLLVLGTAFVLAIRPLASGRVWRAFRLAALCGITVTGIVYAAVIAPYVHLSGAALAYDYIFHYVVPIASVLGFLFVGPRRAFFKQDMVYIVWPILWLVYTMLRGAYLDPVFNGLGDAPSYYPYRFLDIDRVSTGEVVGSIVLIAVTLIGLGFAYIWAEHTLDAQAAKSAGMAR